jgi:cysteine synthase A
MMTHARHIERVVSGEIATHRDFFEKVVHAIGNIPLVEIRKLNPAKSRIFAKLEFMSPSGSIKDRMVAHMIDKAEERGDISEGGSIVEATSGNTGISFAMQCAARGYRFTAVMPDCMTGERIGMMRAYGAKVVLTPAKEDMAGAVSKATSISKRTGAWHADQFSNPDNTEVHMLTTGKELISQMHGRIDAFVAGVGTGGTLMGVAEALKAKGIKARIVAVEPAESAILSGGMHGRHNIQGIGEGFIPKLFDISMVDKIIRIRSKDAEMMTARIAREEGMLCGISSGANLLGCIQVAEELGPGRNIVTVFPDRGERYLSLGIFK